MIDILERERDIFNNKEQIEVVEKELIELAKNNNEQAISILINKYKPLIVKISNKYKINGYDKEDIIQECIFSLYIAIRDYNFNSKLSFKTFLYFIIKKRIYSIIRNSNRQKRIKDFIELKENINLIEDNKVLEKIENKEVIEKVKDKLSELESKVLELYLDNYTINEIAKILNLNLKTIDNTHKRIKIKIKEVVSNV